MAKKFFICNVCGDVHFGEAGPEECPTCGVENAYERAERDEALEAIGV